MGSMSPPAKSLGFAVLCGLGISVGVGTVLLILNFALSLETGAFIGGLVAGQLLFIPVRRGGLAGGLAGLLSFPAYLVVIPVIDEAGLLPPQPGIPEPFYESPILLIVILVIEVAIIAGLGFVGGVVSAYLKSRTTPLIGDENTCPRCQTALPSEAIYCPNCGRKVR